MTTSPFSQTEISTHGFTAVPRSTSVLFSSPDFRRTSPPKPYNPTDPSNAPPSTPLATAVNAYAKQHLPAPTYNHSLRVYHYGRAMQTQHFNLGSPAWGFSAETYLLCCLYHDIGTTPDNLRKTCLSFEWWGGMEALRVLEAQGVGQVQRESVAEAVIRHQDLGESGKITAVGQLLQLATIYGESISLRPSSSSSMVRLGCGVLFWTRFLSEVGSCKELR